MNWHDIRILYLRELRAALRERGIVINSILLPLLLYPVLLWLVFSAMTFIRGQEERFVSRIALVNLPEEHAELRRELEDSEQVELVEPPTQRPAEPIRGGELDAVAEFQPAAGDGEGLDGNFRLLLIFDASKDRSDKARERVVEALDDYRERWVRREADALGVGPEQWEPFRIARRNVASGRELGAFVLGLLLPLLMIIMIAVGCFYPAVDATAGEHERSTWETLMSVAASRSSIVTAKYLYVATMGCVAGVLNVAAMTFSMRAIMAPMLGDDPGELSFQIPLVALPVMAVAAMMLALFLAAGMMLFASFARTFKEGQSMVGPFYMLAIIPPLFVQSPDLELNLKLALIPIVNVVMVLREAIGGHFNWPLIGVTVVVEFVTVVLILGLARRVLQFEDVLLGSYSGSLGKFLKQRVLSRTERRPTSPGELR
ncbi:MAG: ABC transporter permease [bacterium]|nr:ABC transporter permease [bacterium]